MGKALIVNLGSLEDIPIGQGKCFVVKDEEISIFRLRDGKVFAIENRCPHSAGALSDGIVGNGEVVCPLHGHKFNLVTGKGSTQGECVRVFNAWVENGNVLIEHARSLADSSKL